MDGLDEQPKGREQSTRVLLGRALNRARGSLLWEKLWPALATLAMAAGLFLALSWAGLWIALPPLGRAIGLFAFLVITAVAAVPLLLLRLPSQFDGLRRLDRSSGETHRPATTIADEIAANGNDPVAQALWRAHVERALMSARKLKAGWPQPRLSLRDPLALRALTLILVVASFFAASGERVKRITTAFDWQGVVSPANFRIDVWVTPPVYTGRPPVMLQGLRPGETAQNTGLAAGTVAVPVGSQVVIRATGKVNFDVVRKGGIEEAPADVRAALPAGTEERRLVIKGNGSAAVHGVGGSDLTWNFTAIPDRAPTIELIKDPERQARGSLRLDYKMDDDYGVVEAQATFALKDQAPADKPRHPLFNALDYALTLPQARTRSGAAQTTRDLTEHAWAGAEVVMTLVARDEASNEGRSEPHELTLPQRIFVKPIARALIEQRRVLALDAETRPLVLTALDALTIAPEHFTPELVIYLGLRSIYHGLNNAKNDDAMRDVVARMWDMALQIEDGNVSQAEQALRQAQDALRQALERGASDEEIKKQMEQLRAAMDKFLQALAEEMRKNPQQLARPLDRNTRTLSQQDLKSMLDRLEQMARSGNKDAARQLLDQIQSMLENLQMARPGAQGEEGDDDMMSALDELGDMIRKQQQLRDKTFKEGQDQRRGQRNQRGKGDPQMGDLKQDQQALKDRLNKLLEQLRQRGLGQDQKGQGEKSQGEKGENGKSDGGMGQLGDAGDAMGQAEGELGEGDAEGAVGSQGRALEAMRKGAQGLAQQMQQNGMGMGQGPGQPGRNGRQRADQNTDPLGRPLRGRDYGDDVTVKVPGEIDAQRARRILEELRKRFGESARPQLELDYIERLLKDF
ncbi:MAG: TIGR02302 family protein [Pseudolabrys sp.]|nr:TIGR02302 family protein [Pseudolabrys sp.]